MTRDEAMPPLEETRTLVESLILDELSAESRQRLAELLRESSEARRVYVASMHDAYQLRKIALLEFPAAQAKPEPLAAPLPEIRPASPGAWRRSPVRFFSAVGVLTLWIWFAFFISFGSRANQSSAPSARRPAVPATVARLIRTVDAQWEGENLFDGAYLLARQQLTLRQGLAEVRLHNGVRAIVRGPARLQLLEREAVRLTTGQLTASVPLAAHGFRVETPLATVIDLGTEFGVAIASPSAVQVAVFAGAVQVERGAAEANGMRLTAGQSLLIHENAAAPAVLSDASVDQFVRVMPPRTNAYVRWQYNFDDGRVRGVRFPGLPLAGQDNWLAVQGKPLVRADAATLGDLRGNAGASGAAKVLAVRPHNDDFHCDLAGAERLILSFVGRCGSFGGGRSCAFGLGVVQPNGDFVEAIGFGCDRTRWFVSSGGVVRGEAERIEGELDQGDEFWLMSLAVDLAAHDGAGQALLSGVELGGERNRRTFLTDVNLNLKELSQNDSAQWNAIFFSGRAATLVDQLTISVLPPR